MAKLLKAKPNQTLPKGFPTSTVDISGKTICLGDEVTFDFPDDKSSFIVVFEDNAFRKKYKTWNDELEKPFLQYGNFAKEMRFKIVKKK